MVVYYWRIPFDLARHASSTRLDRSAWPSRYLYVPYPHASRTPVTPNPVSQRSEQRYL